MLFPYKYIIHEIEKFQKYSDFLFLEVWYDAKKPFSSAVLSKLPELKSIYERLHNEDSEGARFFNSHVEEIYNEFKKLKPIDRNKLKNWYKINNSIYSLCENRNLKPINYKTLIKKYPVLGVKIKSFYTKLYGKESPFNLAAFGDLSKIIDNHYKKFVEINDEEICPFCGIKEIKGVHHSKREAYDHFIPKSKYPFSSINFKNLAPMCNDCNSSYKLTKEPLMHIDPITKKVNNIRRKSFYAYSYKKINLETSISLTSVDIANLSANDIAINVKAIDPVSYIDRIEGWKEVYGIDERYKAKVLSKRGANKWYNELQETINLQKLSGDDNKNILDLYDMKIKEANADLLDNANFIKKAFLEECRNKKLFLK
ncbi:MAG: hypothetical protein IM600_00595 [Bacteroidetes bacterium]|nr:hypothetical protein [Bacteroidota bacterium]MCA6441899.1 hypothetical protein [Bacteroidota bacterium]